LTRPIIVVVVRITIINRLITTTTTAPQSTGYRCVEGDAMNKEMEEKEKKKT